MSQRPTATRREKASYACQTRLPLNSLAFVAPLLVVYHASCAWMGAEMALVAPRMLRWALEYFGATAAQLPALLIVAVLLLQQVLRRHPWKIHPRVLAGMVGESMLWTAPLIAASYLTHRLTCGAASLSVSQADILPNVLLAVGAGVYEEFLFRLVLISLLLICLVDVIGLPKNAVAIAAVAVSAVLFSLAHSTLLGGAEAFHWQRFVFRALAGALLAAAFIFRGFGVAVGAHVSWNLFVYMTQ